MERELEPEAHEASAWVAKGQALASLMMGPGNVDVLIAFERAVELDPTLPTAWLGNAMALRAIRNYDDALDAEARALALDLESPSAWLSRSRTLSLLLRHEEALAALERAMRLSPAIAEDWHAWNSKQQLFSWLERQDEAEAAQQRYWVLLEIAAGILPTETSATLSPAQRQLLVEKINHNEGSLDEQDLWLKMVERWETENDMYEMEALALSIAARRLTKRLNEEWGSPLTKEQLVALVQQIMTADGTEEEQAAWLLLLAEETGASQGSITDDIYWPQQEMTADKIANRAIERGKRH
jgi:tetratricopeptide (TPR) repeat protein